MSAFFPGARGLARVCAAAGAVLSALMFGLAIAGGAAQLPAGSPPNGAVTLVPASGDSGTTFQMVPPTAAACNNSGANGWRYQTFITPIGNDPSQIPYSPLGQPGPLPTANLRNGSSTIRNLSPAIGNNFISQQALNFTSPAFAAANLAPGDYWVGFTCTSPVVDGLLPNEQFWTAAITITAQAGAGPNGFTYSPAQSVPTTTTAPTTTVLPTSTTAPAVTTTRAATVTTTAAGTTTTVAGSTTTTASTSTTSTTSTTTSTVPAVVALPPASGGASTLAATGQSPFPLVLWAVLFLVCGRMVVLLGRKPKVLPARRR